MSVRTRGFTLIELMVVVAIVGILAAIAYPSYEEQMFKTRRSDAEVGLTQVSNEEQQYFANHNSYDLTLAGPSPKGFYSIGVWVSPTYTSHYVLSATPVATGPQANDGTFYLGSNGAKNYLPPGGALQVGWP